MRVTVVRTADQLASLRKDWNRLAGTNPFRSWEWLESWWRHYGAPAGHELFTLLVFDDAENLVGVVPLYRETTMLHGRVLRLLGAGEVCSESVGVFAEGKQIENVVDAAASFLAGPARDEWHLIDLPSVDSDDATTRRFAESFVGMGPMLEERPADPCWRFALSEDWNAYLASLPKGHATDVRRLQRKSIDSGRASVVVARTESERCRGMSIFRELHQKRQHVVGHAGCFASPAFAAFHEEVSQRLLEQGRLRLCWAEIDHQAIAVSYSFVSDGRVLCYQTGWEPAARPHSPGHLMNTLVVRQAIAEGQRTFDFLRGDEPYKAVWGARPHAMVNFQIVSPAPVSRLRHQVRQTTAAARRWAKTARASLRRPLVRTGAH